MNPSITEILTHFSFTEAEAEIYVAVLSLEKPGVREIAHKINKQRTATYFHIKKMLTRGVLKETRKGRLLRFVALAPAELGALLDRQMTDYKSVLPQLETLRATTTETPLIEVMESSRGYYHLYDELSSLPIGGEFRVLQGRESLVGELQLMNKEQLERFFTRVVERKIETRGIFTKESLGLPKKMLDTRTHGLMSTARGRIWHLRTLSEAQLPFQQLMFIYGNKVAFAFPKTAMVVTITHAGVADALRTIFDTVFLFGAPIKAEFSG